MRGIVEAVTAGGRHGRGLVKQAQGVGDRGRGIVETGGGRADTSAYAVFLSSQPVLSSIISSIILASNIWCLDKRVSSCVYSLVPTIHLSLPSTSVSSSLVGYMLDSQSRQGGDRVQPTPSSPASSHLALSAWLQKPICVRWPALVICCSMASRDAEALAAEPQPHKKPRVRAIEKGALKRPSRAGPCASVHARDTSAL